VPIGQAAAHLLYDAGRGRAPTFILFTDRDIKLHFSFERFLENQIREAFGFKGTPIWFKVRAAMPPRMTRCPSSVISSAH